MKGLYHPWPLTLGLVRYKRLWNQKKNLKVNNIENATVGKRRLEQKQRDDAKYRVENNITYQTRLFSKQGDGWKYNNDLKTRRLNGDP